jgi:chromosome segregation protein
MLRRLELIGFKSFADKTEFEFSPGITAIVGPNGSGKSNIVDAVRWVLGEQSAKSLRGGEMADVIFNGSTSRRSLGLAEVTMTFDNSRRRLATEADEIQITRRVYRDGEGEYLINQRPSRLKDIRDLFLGSGAGTDAYCVIEQGRVDVLLQASTKDRRTIFEEAAGISRFKARKVETLRKLERVEQNLQRLRDIVEEVEKQLRSVKLQAAKARRAVEYHNRLKELRTAIGLQEYHELTERLTEETAVLARLQGALGDKAEQVSQWEAESRRLDEALAILEARAREQELLLTKAREQIAADEATLNHGHALFSDLEVELSQLRRGLWEIAGRVRALDAASRKASADLDLAENQHCKQSDEVRAAEERSNLVAERLAELTAQIEVDKVEHLEQMRQAARLQNEATGFRAQLDALRRERERLRLKTAQASEHLSSVDIELNQLSEADVAVQVRLADTRGLLNQRREESDRLARRIEQTQQTINDLRGQQAGLVSRIEVLERLERSREGLDSGIREVLELMDGADSTWQMIVGRVGDLLSAGREYAGLIDIALGEKAQWLVVRDASLLDAALRERPGPFSSRVTFIPLRRLDEGKPDGSTVPVDEVSQLGSPHIPSYVSTPQHPAVVARADRLVQCDSPELSSLVVRLLGNTLIVRDLASAREIAGTARGFRFVTLEQEVLEADGTLTVGRYQLEGGILSRKSELLELKSRSVETQRQINASELELAGGRERLGILDREMETIQAEINVLAEQAGDLRTRISQHRDRRQGLNDEVALGRSEISGIEKEIQSLDEAWSRSKEQAESAEQQVQMLQQRLHSADREIRAGEQERQAVQQRLTTAQVALAQTEARVQSLVAQQRQIDADLGERRQEAEQEYERLRSTRGRSADSQANMLRASASLAEACLGKEDAETKLAEVLRERDRQRKGRQELAERTQAAQAAWRAQQEQAHARELVVNDMNHHRDTLVSRLREDYQLDLAELHRAIQSGETQPPAPLEPTTVNDEITELRRKLDRLGGVNLESLQELDELESRANSLHAQSTDLASAKQSLEAIIGKINQDSRRLFLEMFAAIRTHFHELFRKLFGGGMADIVLEDENDILESGIEIIARPPGKELRSISLLSGGEKTLTAVALLLAMFRSKPSPFCILDEVDAALDEANIGRFTAVLREFLDQSHFIIITHSKRTMTVADVLYGITMQESGISKRVAVRFEDWATAEESAAAEPAA